MDFRVLVQEETEKIAAFESAILKSLNVDGDDAMIMGWHAPWRKESLDFYASKGWSFAAWSGDSLKGYFLAQPIVFFRGLTQTLWVEHLAGEDEDVELQLIDLARRYARDKHLQTVVFQAEGEFLSKLLASGGKPLADKMIEFKSTKVSS